ncbi:MAG: hypothetical protein ACXWRU_18105 [Pseudobdellovibrionaceae bacterium]
MNSKLKIPYLFSFIFLIPIAKVYAVTIYPAVSCSATDIQSAITSASNAIGDAVVQLPVCSVTSSNVSIDTSSGFTNLTSLTVQGTGILQSVGSSGQTNMGSSTWTLTTSPNKKIRISNITFPTGSVTIQGTGRPGNGGGWRVDHLSFNAGTDRPIWISGYTYGVVDHSSLISNSAVLAGIREALSTTSGDYSDGGNAGWLRAPTFGTAEAVYFEDNYFEYITTGVVHMCVDADSAGRYVARNNTTKNCYFGSHDLSSITDSRSVYSWEVYNNTMSTTGNYASGLINFRGGTGYVYNNTFTTTDAYPFYAGSMTLTNYRSFDYAGALPWSTACGPSTILKFCKSENTSAHSCTSDSDCGGVAGSCVFADNPKGNGYDYPCRDQIGRSTSDMNLLPALFWNNRLSIAGGAFTYQQPSITGGSYTDSHIVVNRDYCTSTSSMPASCGGVNTVYTPYTYPHPLVQSTGTPSTIVLNAPQNLRVL